MKLLIFEKPNSNRKQVYRGTDRFGPSPIDHLSEHHPANQAYVWYAQYGEEIALDNLDKSVELIREYARLDPAQNLELLEIAYPNEPFETSEHTFIGYDLSAFLNFSLLSWGLKIDEEDPSPNTPKDDIYWDIFPLIKLTYNHFRPLLNSYGLFNDYKVADECLTCLMALQKIRPNLWENEDFIFEVVKLAIVSIPDF